MDLVNFNINKILILFINEQNKFIGIIDYQAGNISSLKNSILEIGYKPVLIKNSTEIKQFSKIILPGVGSFQTAIENLKKIKLMKL